jgi:N-acetyl-gamma-glutamyl-phosphate reductase
MITAGIIGASGYTGQELLRLLAAHPQVTVTTAVSRTYAGQTAGSVYGSLRSGALPNFSGESIEEAAQVCDVLFLALPHGTASGQVTAEILKKTRIIDLGADYRLSSREVYENWYHTAHLSPELLSEAVYGLCELNRDAVKTTRLVANPGCYTTCAILTLAPALKAGLIDPASLIIDAKSGVSGAGRALKTGSLFCEVSESVKAYGVGTHRHTPEIEEQLSLISGLPITVSFTPHLIPMNRGILITAYGSLLPGVAAADVKEAYAAMYADERFVRLLPENEFPETRWVTGSNYCDIGYTVDTRTGRLVLGGAIDNLVKGAAGQAVQNMNILFGLPEETGIDMVPMFPG